MKFLTDVHTHSKHSYDGVDTLSDMLAAAQAKGIAFYGVSEHFDFEIRHEHIGQQVTDAAAYFHDARHLQEDYAGVMNVLVGAEFGFGGNEENGEKVRAVCEKYAPDFVVNSVHAIDGEDYYYKTVFYKNGVLRPRKEVYEEYLALVEKSLDAPYPYDIVAHIGYLCRYAPYEDKTLSVAEFQKEWDSLFLKLIQKGKILEVNSSAKGLPYETVPSYEALQRYYELGGRLISFASDAHAVKNIAYNRERIVENLKKIGFTHITVPYRGEYIKVDL